MAVGCDGDQREGVARMGVYSGKLAGWALVATATIPGSGGFSRVIDQVVLKVGRSVIPGMLSLSAHCRVFCG